jgi:hypothetical protein
MTPASPSSSTDQLPDHGWRILDSVTNLIGHADSKAGAILAACGVIGGLLFSLVSGRTGLSAWAIVPATACAALAGTAAGCAGMALRPRRIHVGLPFNALYFEHIARVGGDSATRYGESLRELLRDTETLTDQLVAQIWISSRIAVRKYDWVDRAMLALFGSLTALGLTALLIAVR